MKDKERESDENDMKEEYDFSVGIRGKYSKRYSRGSNIIVLDPDVAEMFPDSSSVNDALRALVKIARRDTDKQPPSSSSHSS